jgi:hypothetical protein
MKSMIHDHESRHAGKSMQEFYRWQTMIRRIRPLVAGWIGVLLLSSEAFPATFPLLPLMINHLRDRQ